MTSPEVNVGSIVARVALDTSGLKRGEADASSSLKRTTAQLDRTAKSADTASASVSKTATTIRRSADVQVDAIRRTTSAKTQADRETARSARAAESEARTRGAAAGYVVAQVGGQLLDAGTSALQNGKGGTRDQAAGALQGATQGALLGGAIGSVVPVVGTVAGAVVGGAVGGVSGAMSAGSGMPSFVRQAFLSQVKQARDAGFINQAQAMQIIAGAPKEFQADLTELLKVQLAGPLPSTKAPTKSERALSVSSTQLARATSATAAVHWSPVGSQFDVAPDTTTGDPGKAAQRVDAASTRVANAQDRVTSAQRRLNDVRKNSKATTSQLAAAEQGLATAQRHLADAQSTLAKRRDDAAKAGGSTSLGSSDLLKRSADELQHQAGLTKASKALLAKGVSGPVLQNLEDLEKTAPGTMARIAKELTPAMVHQLNADQGHLQRSYALFLQSPLQAAQRTALAESQRAAKAYAAQISATYSQAMQEAGVPLPVGQRGPASRFSPVGTDPRQYGPIGNPDNPRKGSAPDVTFTGPVTIVSNDKQGILADSRTRVNALSRP